MKLISLLFSLFVCVVAHCQLTTFNTSWSSTKLGEKVNLVSVDVREDGVYVNIEVQTVTNFERLNIGYSNNTYLYSNGTRALQLTGLYVDGNVITNFTGYGWDNVAYGQKRSFVLYFRGTLPKTTEKISVIDNAKNGFYWKFNNVPINFTKKRTNYLPFYSESDIKSNIDKNNDGICGIYENVTMDKHPGATLACVKDNGEWVLIHASSPQGFDYYKYWDTGDIRARLRTTATPGIFIADKWMKDNNETSCSMYVTFDGSSMNVKEKESEKQALYYLKTYPQVSSSGSVSEPQAEMWTGTGFALNNGYIVTNNHVVKNATHIKVIGVNGNRRQELKAEVVATDPKNDVAVIKINDYRFDGFGQIPYAVKNTVADVGVDVFVLGYPMTDSMGEEIKLTNGIISSRSGYQDDPTMYQTTAPLQPGNSGGPMFDSDGNVIGITQGGIPSADNVGYAVKTTYLCNLISSSISSSIIPNNNTVAGKTLPEKVAVLRNYVFFIICDNK